MNKVSASFIKILRHPLTQRTYSSAKVVGGSQTYKSDISLDKLYPGARLQLYTPAPPTNKDNKFSGYIPINQLQITYSRSSGPGGQHVNTVNTKVDLRFKLADADWIPEKTRQKLIGALQNKVTKEGFFVIKSDVTRSQQLNLADALEKLRNLIREFEIEAPPPSADTLEKMRKRQERAARERLQIKRERSQVKAIRQGPSAMDA